MDEFVIRVYERRTEGESVTRRSLGIWLNRLDEYQREDTARQGTQ